MTPVASGDRGFAFWGLTRPRPSDILVGTYPKMSRFAGHGKDGRGYGILYIHISYNLRKMVNDI
ncbi:MAG: hypothetical protein A3J66_01480 [Candidatus Magasanikbacteria bacterium RIFCSPHIGHO2_02_FULL_47_14]|uniref:Uncharacterized protein n=1 Tax=Candidatus Magasanikbacteria bacterium RIFCSPHIGHO2_02_FULL_47_14 TaxID=1798680 RepID=A0A1F6MB62_9BACT|nr:MAG: hypothetical protein A3J66_01480 [Candidatus Magasanikbacteria bacterium RIFCSPHIGHO2_02_FULL_47_14]